jgi:tRNA threonylcarbamoyladenosine biosynthesis protein TsaE
MIEQKVNLEELKIIACDLASNSKIGDVICLYGDLGVGKTQFSKFFIQALAGETTEVTSPTFPIVQIYKTNIADIWHFDLYRLKNREEIYEIGIEDANLYGISLIEWPEIVIDLLPNNRIDINIEYIDENNRKISIKPRINK